MVCRSSLSQIVLAGNDGPEAGRQVLAETLEVLAHLGVVRHLLELGVSDGPPHSDD